MHERISPPWLPIAFSWLCLCIPLVIAPQARAQNGSPHQELFETRIRPVLVEHCYECHSAAAQTVEGNLALDHRDGILQGGDSGAAIVPGNATESLLLKALQYQSLQMPPSGKLSDEIIADFQAWIESGAWDPRDHPPTEVDAANQAWKAKLAERSSWWSLLAPRPGAVPDLLRDAWSQDPIDRFVLAQLESAGLAPSKPATPEVLLRRLSFVLTGMPPTPQEVIEFQQQWLVDSSQATERLVDRLLASPAFGERMARHWMDVIRYTDTYGYEWDIPAKGSWEYRDYLIRAFNQDVGFDQLIREQLAGDLLASPRVDSILGLQESLIGPMFFHFGERRHGSSLDFNGVHQEMIDSQIDAFSKAFLGMTVACARCHDHKLDAVSQRDYYALASVFMTPRWTSRSIDTPEKYLPQIESLKRLQQEIRNRLSQIWLQQLDSRPLDWNRLVQEVSDDSSVDDIGHPLLLFKPSVTWIAPKQMAATAEQPATRLIIEEDGITVRAEGEDIPQTDRYVVTFSTDAGTFSHLQLRALTHPSLGMTGPGRTSHGNFVLSHIEVHFDEAGQGGAIEIPIASATADYQQPNYPVAAALQPDAIGWGVGLGGNLDRTATFAFDQPLVSRHGGTWTVTLRFLLGSQHALGRFQILAGSNMLPSDPSDFELRDRWMQMQRHWKEERERRVERNRAFAMRIQFEQPGLPEGWAMEGSGLQHGWAGEGTPRISLEGASVIAQFLAQGYHTHALSSKLPGAIRMPDSMQWPAPFLGLQLAGGEWAGYRSIPQNAFLNEGPVFFDPTKIASWTLFSTTPPKNGVTRILHEISTPDLNANFPPRTGVARMGSRVLPNEDMGENKSGWFSLTGIYASQQAGEPADELAHFGALYDRPPPANLESLKGYLQHWLRDAIVRWADRKALSGDARILNWLLQQRVLANDFAELPSDLVALVDQYRAVEGTIEFPRSVNSMDERHLRPIAYRLNVRGNVHDEGDPVPHGFLEVFQAHHPIDQSPGSGRLELAEYLASDQNPQTARVYVNRLWQWVFGTGLVDTPSDLGKLGGRPSHPELLDWLAIRFMEEGWSTKAMLRRLVLSQTFRQSGAVSSEGSQFDPRNRWLHHYPTRRLEAEAVRDSLLKVAGRLDTQLHGRPIRPHRTAEDGQKRLFSGPLDGKGRRSIYLEMSIMQPPEFLVGFNLPDLKIPSGRRDQTNVPAQSLILLNHPFVIDMANNWGERLALEDSLSVRQRIDQMFLTALGRPASEEELIDWQQALQDFVDTSVDPEADHKAWGQLVHALLNTKEFLYYR
jgi:PAS domain-containing protein